MKTNLSNFPMVNRMCIEWKENFTKELQQILEAVEKYPHNRKYMEGRAETIKEILGQ